MKDFNFVALKEFLITPLGVTIIAILSAIIVAIVFYIQFRSYLGSFWCKRELGKLSKKDYFILNDVMVRDRYGVHHIDHIVISKYGVFVIELKNYLGLILGTEYDDNWIQCIGKEKYYFKNPIRENAEHIEALKEVLNLPNQAFVSIVCMANEAKLKIETAHNVIRLEYVDDLIKSYQEPRVMDNLEVMLTKLKNLNITDKKIRSDYAKTTKERIRNDNIPIDSSICLKCGGQLIRKTTEKGNSFLECSNPKCHFKTKIKN